MRVVDLVVCLIMVVVGIFVVFVVLCTVALIVGFAVVKCGLIVGVVGVLAVLLSFVMVVFGVV